MRDFGRSRTSNRELSGEDACGAGCRCDRYIGSSARIVRSRSARIRTWRMHGLNPRSSDVSTASLLRLPSPLQTSFWDCGKRKLGRPASFADFNMRCKCFFCESSIRKRHSDGRLPPQRQSRLSLPVRVSGRSNSAAGIDGIGSYLRRRNDTVTPAARLPPCRARCGRFWIALFGA